MSSPYNGNPEYALNVYGSGDSQAAAPGQGNLIKMHNMSGGNGSGVHPVVGGRRRRGKSGRRGGTGLGAMLVPAGLVLADNYTYNRLRGKKQSFKRGRGRGRKSVSSYFGGNEGYIEPKVGGSDSGLASMIPGVKMGGDASIPEVKMGGNPPPVVSQKGGFPPPKFQLGGSTLVDLAIPAGFVYANDRYYNRKNKKTTYRKRRTSRSTRGRRRR